MVKYRNLVNDFDIQLIMPPQYAFEKIKFATDPATFEKAVKLYEEKKVVDFMEEYGDYVAVVHGTKPYKVSVSGRHYDRGTCECYMGQNNYLCKHMVAVAIRACLNGEKIAEEEKEIIGAPVCSGRLGELGQEELSNIKKIITEAMKYIKSYNGSSRIWFAYQDSLSEGRARLSAAVSKLPVSEQTARILIDLLLRLDKKLRTGGIDDSDGVVGDFIQEAVVVLREFVKLCPSCVKSFKKLCGQSTCFDWEEPLVKLFDDDSIH